MTLLREERYLRLGREIKSLLGNQKLTLASLSPRRQQILTEIGLAFEVLPSGLEEHANSLLPPEHVLFWALRKAGAVEKKVKTGVILAADTEVVLDGKILGKPKNQAAALGMLCRLSGRTHVVYTGVAVVKVATKKRGADFQTTPVTFNVLTEAAINEYLATGESADKAGAYGIQGMGSFLVKEINGDLDNVIGLPLVTVKKLLEGVL